tara:strand:- start:4486 stop:4989 length:504 start_codon:yes stop_codon:yes gene_type:complete
MNGALGESLGKVVLKTGKLPMKRALGLKLTQISKVISELVKYTSGVTLTKSASFLSEFKNEQKSSFLLHLMFIYHKSVFKEMIDFLKNGDTSKKNGKQVQIKSRTFKTATVTVKIERQNSKNNNNTTHNNISRNISRNTNNISRNISRNTNNISLNTSRNTSRNTVN